MIDAVMHCVPAAAQVVGERRLDGRIEALGRALGGCERGRGTGGEHLELDALDGAAVTSPGSAPTHVTSVDATGRDVSAKYRDDT